MTLLIAENPFNCNGSTCSFNRWGLHGSPKRWRKLSGLNYLWTTFAKGARWPFSRVSWAFWAQHEKKTLVRVARTWRLRQGGVKSPKLRLRGGLKISNLLTWETQAYLLGQAQRSLSHKMWSQAEALARSSWWRKLVS